MKIHRWKEVEKESLSPGIARRVIHSGRMTTAQIYLDAGAVVPRHSHDNEQMSHVLEGRLRFEFDSGPVEAGPGDVVEIPSHAPHRVVAIEDSVAMDVFAPIREDWISGDDAYLRNPTEAN